MGGASAQPPPRRCGAALAVGGASAPRRQHAMRIRTANSPCHACKAYSANLHFGTVNGFDIQIGQIAFLPTKEEEKQQIDLFEEKKICQWKEDMTDMPVGYANQLAMMFYSNQSICFVSFKGRANTAN